MDFSKLSDRELLVAEQAIAALQALDKAADDAPGEADCPAWDKP